MMGPLERRQIRAVLSIEIRKRFLGRGAIVLYLLTAVPLILFAGRAIAVTLSGRPDEIAQDEIAFAAIFRTLILRVVVFFGCVAIFTALFRGEVLDRTLHFYFLAPMRRSVLAAGKFLSGMLAAVLLFGALTAGCWILLYAAHGSATLAERLTSAQGLSHLGAYLLVTTLACAGYGAVFTAAGLWFRAPIVPAIALLIWEGINALLPPILKKLSIIHYLESLLPVPIPADQIAILADPAPAWIAIPGLLGVCALLLALSVNRLRRMEILYGNE